MSSYLPPDGHKKNICVWVSNDGRYFNIVKLPSGDEVLGVHIYDSSTPNKGCPFLSRDWIRKRDYTISREFKTCNCFNPTIVKRVKEHNIRHLSIARCCPSTPTIDWNENDETRGPLLG